jgi:hypothetical protein
VKWKKIAEDSVGKEKMETSGLALHAYVRY